jgi:hypothetical protein
MFHTDSREVVIVFRPETVEAGGARIPLFSIRDQSAAAGRKKVPIDLAEPGEDHAGAFRFAGDRPPLHRTRRTPGFRRVLAAVLAWDRPGGLCHSAGSGVRR